jgi:PAS domain S-box-containing protein
MAASVLSAALDRRAIERRLAASEERYRFLAEHSLDFITLHEHPGGKCLYASPVSERLLGVSPEAYRRAPRLAFVHGEDVERVRGVLERVASGKEPGATVQHRMRRSDGSHVEVESILSLLPDGGGSSPRIMAVTRDVTARREMERSLFEGRRLEAVGFLAGGVAHEFNNLLAGIQGSAEILSLTIRRRDGKGEAGRHLDTIDRLSRRAAAITSQLLAYARRGGFVPVSVSLNRTVEETLPLLQGSLPGEVRVRTELEPDLPPVQADFSLVRQLLSNLCSNAAEAVHGAGTVTVRTRLSPGGSCRGPLPEGWSACRHGSPPPEGRAVLEVEDGGCGMDEATLERIFDPFFSTKFAGRGLGLAAVRGIVESHGGYVEVSSSPGAGTVVSISFPAAGTAAGPEEPAEEGEGRVEGECRATLPKRVLLADDEEDVRQVLSSLIASLGYEVAAARDGRDAVEIFSSRPDDFGLVLLDLVMPGLTGDRAFAAMRRLRPGQKGILSSGYDESGRTGQSLEEGFSGFLHKPYRRSELARRLEEILGPPDRAASEPGSAGEEEWGSVKRDPEETT